MAEELRQLPDAMLIRAQTADLVPVLWSTLSWTAGLLKTVVQNVEFWHPGRSLSRHEAFGQAILRTAALQATAPPRDLQGLYVMCST